MSLVLAGAILAVAAGIVSVLAATAVRLLRIQEGPSEPVDLSGLIEIRARLDGMQMKLDSLPSLWEHERQVAIDAKDHASKQHRLAAQARADAERIRRPGSAEGEDGEDDEAGRLLAEHAGVGDAQGVLPLHPDVASATQDDLTERALAVGWTPYI